MGSKTIGVLALQGDFSLHLQCLKSIGATVVLVRKPEHLAGIDGLIVPGGESTTMHLLMERSGLFAAIQEKLHAHDLPYFGTCAGLILAAKTIRNDCHDHHNDKGFGYVDMTVERNAYGRQVDSFETTIHIPAMEKKIRAAFIRAPRVLSYGVAIETLASYENSPVLLAYKRSLFATFHPELGNTSTLHRYWLDRL